MRNIFFLITILFIGCNSKSKEKIAMAEVKFQKIHGAKYFDYDEIVHYRIELENKKRIDIYKDRQKSELDSIKYRVIFKDIPKSLSDTTFISILETTGYLKNEVEKDKFEKINEIFLEKKPQESIQYACDYIYRDILIFKRKSKTIGIAKICFECHGNRIVGTKANTEEFGMDGDYEKLENILSTK